jgi:uncharacterized protein YegL
MQNKVNCLPIYIVIDTSYSMSPFEQLLNESIENLYDVLITSPRISDFAEVSILTYDADARVIMDMTSIQAMNALPDVQCGGVTNFSKALHLLRSRIDADVTALNSAGREVLRPVAFVLTDGVPTDEKGHPSDSWTVDFRNLTDPSWRRHPNVVPFGYGGAQPDDMLKMATIPGAAFIAEKGGTSEALQKVIPALLNTLVASARERELRLPAEVDGFIRVSPEVVE